ncbi:hypothetical protein [Pelagicoccus sp. SDUM812003]|uniref:hypothetical protein n=1 Tax=Pelagicoccus sp. SDUM812003 TaxID=3041267 RepID=UPI0028103906|nr:hypothetical protein [Pelagicoccus sp. SDUM812003]MDQ8205518.1 hypothetical protein [Pelagicoccus sp. SDUM812003]
MNNLPKLYLPEDQADTHPVAEFLETHGIGFRDRSGAPLNEVADETGIDQESISGKLPVLQWQDGSKLENCDTDSLISFLHDRGYELEDS